MEPSARVLKGTPHPRDAGVVFDDPSHTYTVHGNLYTGSATGFLALFFGNFDAVATSIRCAEKGEKDPSYKYAGMTAEAIRKKWEDYGNERAGAGTIKHANVENYLKGYPYDGEPAEFSAFLKFDEEATGTGVWTHWDAEWSIYNDKVKLAGQIDMVYANVEDAAVWHAWDAAGRRGDAPHMRLWLVDWKFSKPLVKKGFKNAMARGPCKALGDGNLHKYWMQLNTYQWLVETNYNAKVERKTIVRFVEGSDEFERFEVPSKQRMLREMLAYRELVVAGNPPLLESWTPVEFTGGKEDALPAEPLPARRRRTFVAAP